MALQTASRVSFFQGLNPLGLLKDAQQLTPHEFLRTFYTQRGLHDKLKDVDALVAAYGHNLEQLYVLLDDKYGTSYATNPPPVAIDSGLRPSEPVDSTATIPVAAVASPPRAAPNGKPPVNKIIMLGNSGVGKTNLLSRLNKGEFNDEFTSTIGVEFLTHVTPVDGVDVKAQIWDTAGQERFHAMMATYYRKSVGALLIFDVTDRASLTGVERWLDQLLNVAEPGLHAVLVGNKCDIPMGQRAVSTEEAQQFAASHHMSYVETSAKTGHNVEHAFHSLIASIHRTQLADAAASASVAVSQRPRATTVDLNDQTCHGGGDAPFFGDACKIL